MLFCAVCKGAIPHGPYLICPHGNRPLHPECLVAELDKVLLEGKEEQYRRCDCEQQQELNDITRQVESIKFV